MPGFLKLLLSASVCVCLCIKSTTDNDVYCLRRSMCWQRQMIMQQDCGQLQTKRLE